MYRLATEPTFVVRELECAFRPRWCQPSLVCTYVWTCAIDASARQSTPSPRCWASNANKGIGFECVLLKRTYSPSSEHPERMSELHRRTGVRPGLVLEGAVKEQGGCLTRRAGHAVLLPCCLQHNPGSAPGTGSCPLILKRNQKPHTVLLTCFCPCCQFDPKWRHHGPTSERGVELPVIIPHHRDPSQARVHHVSVLFVSGTSRAQGHGSDLAVTVLPSGSPRGVVIYPLAMIASQTQETPRTKLR
jgi:hypothetical protein